MRDTLEAYEEIGGGAWGVFSGKEPRFFGDDAADLEKFLGMLNKGRSQAPYTLRLYKGADASDLDRNSPYVSSFNFMLDATGRQGVGSPVQATGGGDIITQEINNYLASRVRDVIKNELEGGGAKEKKKSFKDVLMGWLEEPEDLIEIVQGIRGIFNPLASVPATVGNTRPVRVGSADGGAAVAQPTDAERLQRVSAVLDRLDKADPNILDNLELLADLAEQNPDIYQIAIKKLRAMS